jgi:hypothetical protein
VLTLLVGSVFIEDTHLCNIDIDAGLSSSDEA